MNPRRTMFIGLGLFALLLLATTPMMVLAEGDGTELSQDPTADGTARGQRLRLRVDLDGDGYISLREFNAFVNGRLEEETVKRIFNAADKDQDGQLTRREFVYAVRLCMKASGDNNGRTPDKDGDGYISLREFNAFVNGRLDEGTVKRIFNAADADQDGQLKGREFGQAVSMAARAKVKDVLATADKDGDGYISLREFNAFVNGRLDEGTVKRVFNAADKDQDGKLSKREFNYAIRLGLKAYRSQESSSSEESSEDGSGSDSSMDSARKNIRQRIRERIRQRLKQRQRSSESDE